MIEISGLKKILFVSNMGEDSISVINVEGLIELGRICLFPICNNFREIDYIYRKPVVGPHSLKADKNRENIYSVNSFDNSISIIEACSCIVKESFFAGSHPNDMVLSMDELYAYVTNADSDSVSIIDILSKKIIAQVSVGVMPHGICLSPDGEFIYVANMDSSTITIIDTWSNSKVTCIKVGECPIEVVTSNDGRYLFVSCSFLGSEKNGFISIISTNNYKIIKNIEVGMIPVQMVLSENEDYLYVTCMGNNSVYGIDLKRFEIHCIVKTGNMARGIIMDNEKRLFVTNSQDNKISIIRTEDYEITNNIEVGIEPTSMLYIDRSN